VFKAPNLILNLHVATATQDTIYKRIIIFLYIISMLYAVTMGIGPAGKVCITCELLSIVQIGGMQHMREHWSQRKHTVTVSGRIAPKGSMQNL
jgi:hypothetical protein